VAHAGGFTTTTCRQQQETHKRVVRTGVFGGGPQFTQFTIVQDATARALFRPAAAHATYQRNGVIVRTASVPSHHLANGAEHPVGRNRAVLVLNCIEQPDDVAALDISNWHGADCPERQPLKIT
jgi:hypothetical protein